ncbi:hypothetical protein ColTof3_08588 [Colletotrichum tofieldiae]|nr:hypothetical protein ColTof3_08588 [Colletotrichum tofieldiae]
MARLKFFAEGLPTWYCCQYPSSLQDRITVACRFSVMLFLLDDLLEHMSLEEGSYYNERLMSIITGDVTTRDGSPVEKIVWDVWNDMKAVDDRLAHDLVEPMFDFWRSHTDSRRLDKKGTAAYLEYRARDVAAQ